jgi:hypothetical protein
MDAPNKYKVLCTSLERKKEEEELDVRPNVLLALIRTTTVLASVGVCGTECHPNRRCHSFSSQLAIPLLHPSPPLSSNRKDKIH